jgi:predicted phage terminase large subunit-like protein
MHYTPELRDAILRLDLASFIASSFRSVVPGAEFMFNWHVNVLADYLMRVTEGEIKRLIIAMPPRYLKSFCVSVAWPAWMLGHDPTKKIIAASYAQGLSLRHSTDCRLILESEEYRRLFPFTEIAKGQNQKHRFATTRQGFRFATSVGGTLTGDGGDILIADDPHNPTHIFRDSTRQQVHQWFEQTFASRLNDKRHGAIVIVMQRLHPEDLVGYLLEKQPGDWTVLTLPAIAQTPWDYKTRRKVYHREAGDLLHEAREDQAVLDAIKRTMGNYPFAAQYQQNPVALEGGMVHAAWFRYEKFQKEAEGVIVQSWDTAIKAGKQHDYSVCTTWCYGEERYVLLDVFRKKLEYPLLKKAVEEQAARYQPDAILIEDKASGQSLLQELRGTLPFPLIPIRPTQDKLTRFAGITPLFEGGKVFLTKGAGWLGDYETELLAFPNGVHDDQADSTSQALSWIKKKEMGGMRVRRV